MCGIFGASCNQVFVISSLCCFLFQSARKTVPWFQRNEETSSVPENHEMLGRPSVTGLAGRTDNRMHVPSGSELSVALEVSSTPDERGNSNAAKGGGSSGYSGGGSGGGESRTEQDVIYNKQEENYETDHSEMS
jgi:hypothetical protein